MKKKFYTIEGGDGSGKTTVSQAVVEKLTNLGYKAIYTREPGGEEVAEKIRNIIFDYQIDELTEVLLFAAARREHLINQIIPKLETGTIVISDRYVDSSLAYQGVAGNNDIKVVENINNLVIEEYIPNKTFFLDIEPEIALNRIKGDRELNRLDLESLEYHQKVYSGYQNLAKVHNQRYYKIDAKRSVESITDEIVKVIIENE